MKLLIHGVHLTLNPELKAYVEKRLLQSIERFADDEAAELEVMLRDTNGTKGGEDKECSVTLRMPGSAGLHISETTSDIFQSIDLAQDRLVKAAKREMEKKRTVSGHRASNPASRFAEDSATQILPE